MISFRLPSGSCPYTCNAVDPLIKIECCKHAQFLGGANLLTGHTDAHWRAVRKGIVPAFSAGNVRYAHPWTHARCLYPAISQIDSPSAACILDTIHIS